MQSLTIAAASSNLSSSPAMLITRQRWEIRLRIGRCLIVKDGCIVKRFSQKRKLKNRLEWPEGGQVSPQRYAAQGSFCGLCGILATT